MNSRYFRILLRVVPLLLMVVLAGCGGIEWFPEFVKDPTTPDAFSFAAKTGVERGVDVTSETVTVTGLTAATSPISISGATGSTYSINGGAATSSAGTVKNTDTVTVTHKSASTLGASTTSTLTIGNQSANFVSTTKFVKLSKFSTPVLNVSFANISSNDSVTHTVSIKDSANSLGSQYQVTEPSVVNPDTTLFTHLTQTLMILNGKKIFVRNITDPTATTTLTIDGAETIVPLTTP